MNWKRILRKNRYFIVTYKHKLSEKVHGWGQTSFTVTNGGYFNYHIMKRQVYDTMFANKKDSQFKVPFENFELTVENVLELSKGDYNDFNMTAKSDLVFDKNEGDSK